MTCPCSNCSPNALSALQPAPCPPTRVSPRHTLSTKRALASRMPLSDARPPSSAARCAAESGAFPAGASGRNARTSSRRATSRLCNSSCNRPSGPGGCTGLPASMPSMALGPRAAATTIGSSLARTAAAARRGFDATEVRNRRVAADPLAIARLRRYWKAMRLTAMRGENREPASCWNRPAPRATKRARGRSPASLPRRKRQSAAA